MKIAYKIWIDQNGKAFGDGPLALLKGVEETDSLHQSAARMGMSYSKAWGLIRMLERRLGFPLLLRKVGGHSGGGSKLTPEAKDWITHYEALRRDIDRAMEVLFRKHFHSLREKSVKKKKEGVPDRSFQRVRRKGQ